MGERDRLAIERDRLGERSGETEEETVTETETGTGTGTGTEIDRQRHRDTETQRHRNRQREEKWTDRQRPGKVTAQKRQIEREKDRQTDR